MRILMNFCTYSRCRMEADYIIICGVVRFVLAPVPLLVQRRDVICDMIRSVKLAETTFSLSV